MSKKQSRKRVIGVEAEKETGAVQLMETKRKFSFSPAIVRWLSANPYFPGILLFVAAVCFGLFVYSDYGVAWDEPIQRAAGEASYNYIFYGNQDLFKTLTVNYGVGFELLLTFFEKWMNLTDTRAIYLMRHLVTHILFLASIFSAYFLLYRLFKNKFIASLGFIMLLLAPRLYAHSFFNSKDIPFMSMFLITLSCCQFAFEKNKPVLFLVLGLLCGYTTGIRVMGVMLAVFILFFLLIDLIVNVTDKKKTTMPVLNIFFFVFGFCFLLYGSWPYLWKDPVHNFIKSYKELAHFDLYNGYNLFNGHFGPAAKHTWAYFPTWFLITNPEVWLIGGFAGIIWIVINFLKTPLLFLKNTVERNFFLYLVCFFTPIFAVTVLHSVIYDDWRHLYFVYPSFVFMALYFINKILQMKYSVLIKRLCAIQVILLGFFMIKNHPFQHVYFNNLVSHNKEYLHKNYEMDYWGTGYKQCLEHLLNADTSGRIRINCNYRILVENNKMLLPEKDRERIQFADYRNADYLITNFRDHPYDYPSYPIEYSITVLNSTILSIFKIDRDTAKQKKFVFEEIANLKKSIPVYPKDGYAETLLGDMYSYLPENDSAEVYYRQALKLNAKATNVMYALSKIYFINKDYPKSIEINKKAMIIEAKYANPFANVGLAYFRIGNNDSAIFYSKKAIAIEPGFTGPYETISSAYKAKGNLDSSVKYEAIARLNDPHFKP